MDHCITLRAYEFGFGLCDVSVYGMLCRNVVNMYLVPIPSTWNDINELFETFCLIIWKKPKNPKKNGLKSGQKEENKLVD